jgi:hypothetical protein
LIKESLEQTFTRGSDDKLSNIGIGKKAAILKWLTEFNIEKYELNDDLSINIIKHDVWIDMINIGSLPKYIQFDKIYGSFRMMNAKLTTLRGFPTYVKGTLNCESNLLKTLEFITPVIGKDFYCGYNQLVDLKIRPTLIGGSMFVAGNSLLTTQYTDMIERKRGYPIVNTRDED